MQLKGSKTEKNLKDAFAGESQANRRYLYFAAKADVEGYNDVSAVFRDTFQMSLDLLDELFRRAALADEPAELNFLRANTLALREAGRDRLRAEKLGYIFQTFNLLQGFTVLENVLLGMSFGPRGADRAHAREMLGRVGLGHRLDHFPRQLSTGQQQRVAVARALANHPKLVLADEPTGNLDHRNAREALALIREVCREQGAALLLVSHDEEVLGRFELRRDFADLNRPAPEAAR